MSRPRIAWSPIETDEHAVRIRGRSAGQQIAIALTRDGRLLFKGSLPATAEVADLVGPVARLKSTAAGGVAAGRPGRIA